MTDERWNEKFDWSFLDVWPSAPSVLTWKQFSEDRRRERAGVSVVGRKWMTWEDRKLADVLWWLEAWWKVKGESSAT